MKKLFPLTVLGLIFLTLLGLFAFAVASSQQEPPCTSCKVAPKKDLVQEQPADRWQGLLPGGPNDGSSFVNGRMQGGEVVTADYPGSLYIKNIGSHVDGAGMCVTTSITMCAHYQGLREYYGLRDWCANEKGGAWREKVDDQIKRYEQKMGIKDPAPYLQYEGPNPEALLDQLDAARIPFAHTYGWSPRYGHRIAHMVMSVKYNGKYGVVVDNNPMQDLHPESNAFHEWMDRAELVRRMKVGNNGNAWIFAWLVAPPPPCPKVEVQR